ncbi:hypothetical protein [Yersinia artesiana]|uniref:hypothetical protein n=1 Tax=Yersinia artesiana TaxID=2890315 RepID=UPI0015830F62|nr:hypothetical protein [Yersinia artesiana]
MATFSIQKTACFFQKLVESGNKVHKNLIRGFSQQIVKITQSSGKRELPNLQGKRASVEQHSSSLSLSPMPQNQSSPLSRDIALQQQNAPKQPACSLADALAVVKLKSSKADIVPKGPEDKNVQNTLLQELKTKFATDKGKTDQVTDDISDKPLDWIQQEIAQLTAEYNRDEPIRREAEAAVDAKVAKALEAEAQEAANKAKAAMELVPKNVVFKPGDNGAPPPPPPLPPSSFLTPSRGIELKPQDKSKQQTSTLVKALPNDLMQELKAKLAKTRDQSDDIPNRSPNKKQQEVRDEMAKGREAYNREEPNRLAAEAKVDAKVAEARANELTQQAGNKTSTEAEQFKVDLKFDANGVPTAAPPLPPSF